MQKNHEENRPKTQIVSQDKIELKAENFKKVVTRKVSKKEKINIPVCFNEVKSDKGLPDFFSKLDPSSQDFNS